MTHQQKSQSQIGMIGLGVMGRNLLLNMADHGFTVAGYDKDTDKVKSLREESQERNIHAADDIQHFISLLSRPRAVMLLVPAGNPVDAVIKDLLPYLEPGDLIIDAGNSYFKDTDLRTRDLAGKNIQFMGIGISGGEEGARHGPSIMPGGPKTSYEQIRVILEAVSAKINGDPCVCYLGPGSAGHFVKMVHNGIEYGIMQLIAESYDLMKRGLGLNNNQLHDIYRTWNNGILNSYLIEITSQIFNKLDEKTNQSLIDEILAVAQQKGTGMWTSQNAMELQVPTPTIDIAVALRDMSILIKEREQANLIYQLPIHSITYNKDIFLKQLQNSLYLGIMLVYAQGMALLRAASDKYQYHLDLGAVSKIWRGGCIIRAELLEDIYKAFETKKELSNILLDAKLSKNILKYQADLREIICQGTQLGLPIPGLMASMSYLDSYRSAWLPANLIQAQRDYFGSHTYERIDVPGIFHTQWESQK